MKIELIKQLMTEFENSQVFKMKVEIDDIKLELEKGPQNVQFVQETPVVQTVQPVQQAAMPAVEETQEEKIEGTEVTSPLVGVFYPASAPTAAPYVQVGDQVKKGQTLCIVEAMKVMNEIKSPVDGTVLSIHAKNEDPVEYGTVLMVIG